MFPKFICDKMAAAMSNRKIIFLSVLIVLGAVFFQVTDLKFSGLISHHEDVPGVLSQQQLEKCNGRDNAQLYLSIMGHVFDVTEGKEHYGDGAPYNYFVGKDGSRTFITGEFDNESDNKDHIMDLKCEDLINLMNWKNTYIEKYKPVGVLNGRYFDKNGDETAYMKEYYKKLDQCNHEKEEAKMKDQKYPPCNIEWSADEGSRVWCTKTSGGISRGWVGVPRQLYTPGEQRPRCVCVNLDKDNTQGMLKEYDNCHSTATSCSVKDSS